MSPITRPASELPESSSAIPATAPRGKPQQSGRDGVPVVTVYTLAGCVSCERARSLLGRHGISFREVRGDGVRGFRNELATLTGRRSVPQIVIRGRPVGGADDLDRLARAGVLVPLAGGQPFPTVTVRRRLHLAGLLRSVLPRRYGHRRRWRYDVVLLDRDGRVLERHTATTSVRAQALASTLVGHARPTAGTTGRD